MEERHVYWTEAGQAVRFVKSFDEENHIVEPMLVRYKNGKRNKMFGSGHHIVVDKLFDEPPVPYINKKTELAITKLKKVEAKINILNETFKSIQDLTTDLSRIIINKEELLKATTIVYFVEGEIRPRYLGNDDIRNWTISFEIKTDDGLRRLKVTNSHDFASRKIDIEIGLLINPDDKVVQSIARGRCKNVEVEDYGLEKIHDFYLTPELIKRKNIYIEQETQRTIKELQQDIEKSSKKLKELIPKKDANLQRKLKLDD